MVPGWSRKPDLSGQSMKFIFDKSVDHLEIDKSILAFLPRFGYIKCSVSFKINPASGGIFCATKSIVVDIKLNYYIIG
jgi:hypothetical protein